MNLSELIYKIQADGSIDTLALDPGNQFGRAPDTYVGAGILPERTVDGDVIREQGMRYRSIIANDAARFSPVQLKQGAAQFGSMFAKMAESDVGKEYTGQDFEDLRKLLGRGGDGEAQLRVLGWLEEEVNAALLRLNEKHRWDALVKASITRRGDNDYVETVAYPDPAGHRKTVAGDWDDSTYDPFDDLFALYEESRDKNTIFTRIIMSSKTQFRLLRNAKIAERAQFGSQSYVPPNDGILRAPMSVPQLQGVFTASGLPAPEVFDGTYEDSDGTHRYLPEDSILFIGQTGRGENIVPAVGDTFYVANTLGYTGVGTPALRDAPGRVLTLTAKYDDKPGSISAKGWQTSLPVILDPEAVYVLNLT